jgi:ribosome maturation factor RimP
VTTARGAEQIRSVVEPVVADAGFDLDDLVVAPAGKRRLVRVVLDKDGGVTLDECAEVSRHISRALDDTDAMGSAAYTLEVSSRGVSRPLTLPRHWRRSTGRLVAITLSDGTGLRGRVTECDEEAVTLDVDGTVQDVRYEDVAKAVVQVEMTRPPSAGEA